MEQNKKSNLRLIVLAILLLIYPWVMAEYYSDLKALIGINEVDTYHIPDIKEYLLGMYAFMGWFIGAVYVLVNLTKNNKNDN